MSDILGIGVSGLRAFQSLITTTSDNVANSANEAFRRRTTELHTRPNVLIGSTLIGTGVDVGMTTRAADEMLQTVYRENLASQSEFSVRSSISTQVNDLLSSTNTSISQGITKFFAALQQLAAKPGSSNHREVLINESKALVHRVTTTDNRLKALTKDINKQISENVKEINSIATSLAKLNQDIVANTIKGFSEPNELLDQRDQLLDQLSGLVSTKTIAMDNGTVNVYIGNGISLVVSATPINLTTIINPDDPTKIDILTNNGTTQTVTEAMIGGRIGGLRNIQDEIIADTQGQLDRIAISFAMTINAQHKLGIDLGGELGLDYFTDYNSSILQQHRVISDDNNQGTARFVVNIDEISRPTSGPYKVTGDSSALVDVGTLAQLDPADLTINEHSIRATTIADDTLSTVDNASSAIAIAKAINDSSTITGVSAKAEINSLYLGNFTLGALAAGELVINGVNIVTPGTDEATLLRDINAQTANTGVKAVANSIGQITLVAEDGRNIQLATDGNAGVASFQYFATCNAGVPLNKVQKAAVSLQHANAAISIAGTAPQHAGLTLGTTPAIATSLADHEYQLSYDGTTYTLTRVGDLTVIARSNGTELHGEGFTINLLNGAAVAGDKFLIKPTAGGAENFALLINNPNKLAMGSPIAVKKTVSGAGSTAKITRKQVINTSGNPVGTNTKLANAFSDPGKLTPPIRIEFFNDSQGQPTIYKLFDMTNGGNGVQIGPAQRYDHTKSNEIFPLAAVTDTTIPGPNASYLYDPGYRVTIAGDVVAGDVFTINYNSNAPGDNGNAAELRALQHELLLEGGTCSYQDTYKNLVTSIGSIAHTDEVRFEASQSVCRNTHDTLQKKLGVNLDEEASKLIRYQQGYQAAAQVIAIGRTLFDSLLTAISR